MDSKTLNSGVMAWVGYGLTRSGLLAMELAGLTWGRALGRALGWALYALDARHRKVALDNLLQAEGAARDEAHARRIVRKMYEHLGISLAELASIDRLQRAGKLGRLVRIEGLENVREALAHGRGAIQAFAHLGSWEPTGVHFSQQVQPLHSIVRPLDNPLLDVYVERLRARTGQVIIPKWNAAARMREALQANQLLAILMDQDAKEDGVFVDFFGRPASTVKSVAILSLRYRAAVVPVNVYREDGVIWMVHGKPVYPESVAGEKDRVRALTQKLTTILEGYIREHPDQWFWMHRRWKTQAAANGGGDSR
jgi:KDO2-lipid IV(A) lauroyltransferase